MKELREESLNMFHFSEKNLDKYVRVKNFVSFLIEVDEAVDLEIF